MKVHLRPASVSRREIGFMSTHVQTRSLATVRGYKSNARRSIVLSLERNIYCRLVTDFYFRNSPLLPVRTTAPPRLIQAYALGGLAELCRLTEQYLRDVAAMRGQACQDCLVQPHIHLGGIRHQFLRAAQLCREFLARCEA